MICSVLGCKKPPRLAITQVTGADLVDALRHFSLVSTQSSVPYKLGHWINQVIGTTPSVGWLDGWLVGWYPRIPPQDTPPKDGEGYIKLSCPALARRQTVFFKFFVFYPPMTWFV